MDAYRFIEGHEHVFDAFGGWPSSHDGEIHRMVLDRRGSDSTGKHIACVELLLRGWVMTREITSEGHYKVENDSVVHFLFEGISELELDGLNHQNVISELVLELVGESDARELRVELEHCFGLSGSFRTRKAMVLGVEAFRRGGDAG